MEVVDLVKLSRTSTLNCHRLSSGTMVDTALYPEAGAENRQVRVLTLTSTPAGAGSEVQVSAFAATVVPPERSVTGPVGALKGAMLFITSSIACCATLSTNR